MRCRVPRTGHSRSARSLLLHLSPRSRLPGPTPPATTNPPLRRPAPLPRAPGGRPGPHRQPPRTRRYGEQPPFQGLRGVAPGHTASHHEPAATASSPPSKGSGGSPRATPPATTNPPLRRAAPLPRAPGGRPGPHRQPPRTRRYGEQPPFQGLRGVAPGHTASHHEPAATASSPPSKGSGGSPRATPPATTNPP